MMVNPADSSVGSIPGCRTSPVVQQGRRILTHDFVRGSHQRFCNIIGKRGQLILRFINFSGRSGFRCAGNRPCAWMIPAKLCFSSFLQGPEKPLAEILEHVWIVRFVSGSLWPERKRDSSIAGCAATPVIFYG